MAFNNVWSREGRNDNTSLENNKHNILKLNTILNKSCKPYELKTRLLTQY